MQAIANKMTLPAFALLGLACLAAIAQGVDLAAGQGQVAQIIVKGLPVSLLALFALITAKTKDHVILFVALALSAAGDVLIEIAFIFGLLGFLTSHIVYIVLFLKNRDPAAASSSRMALIAVLWLVSLGFLIKIYPLAGALGAPVIVYTLALVGMASVAVLSRYHLMLAGLGGVLFVVSDATLGLRQFSTMPDWTGHLVWWTYFGALFLISIGVRYADER